ncbi:MAG: hypothetical protein PVH19_03720 [Planctomycetia bacterium]|jgi:hypothetical protein
MSQYNLRTVFRQTSNFLLREFFESKGHRLEVEWEELKETQIDGVYEAFLALPDGVRRELDVDLHDVHAVAQSEDGPQILVEKAVRMGLDIAGELNGHDGRYDIAMAALLHYPKVWEAATTLVHVGTLSQRYWYRRGDLPQQQPDVSEVAIDTLRRDISAFYWQAQGRGQLCRIEHQQRNENLDYFFVYLSDHAGTDLVWDDEGHCQRTCRRRAFEVVFVFDRSAGVLDLFAYGGQKIVQPLQEIFASVILGVVIGPEDKSTPYFVEALKNRSFQFATDPEDGIAEVAVRMLRMAPHGNPSKKIIVKLTKEGQPDDIYVSLENDLNHAKLPLSVLRVERATIAMKLSGYGRRKILRFDIGPKSCSLKSESERFRELGEKYLSRWGIDRAG